MINSEIATYSSQLANRRRRASYYRDDTSATVQKKYITQDSSDTPEMEARTFQVTWTSERGAFGHFLHSLCTLLSCISRLSTYYLLSPSVLYPRTISFDQNALPSAADISRNMITSFWNPHSRQLIMTLASSFRSLTSYTRLYTAIVEPRFVSHGLPYILLPISTEHTKYKLIVATDL